MTNDEFNKCFNTAFTAVAQRFTAADLFSLVVGDAPDFDPNAGFRTTRELRKLEASEMIRRIAGGGKGREIIYEKVARRDEA